MSETLLIVAAGPLQVPAIQEAASLGLKTVTVDANPLAPGMAIADVRYPVDILDAAAVEAIARAERISGIMTLCTDAPVRTVAAVGSALGLPVLRYAAAQNATDKRRMRTALLHGKVPQPAFREIHSMADAREAAESLGYPFALKIPCSSGSRGVYRVENRTEIACYLAEARKHHSDGALLAEEWMEGDEVSVEGACANEQVHIVQVTDKLIFEGPFPV